MSRAGGTRLSRYRCFLSDLAGFTTPPLPPALDTNRADTSSTVHRLGRGGENGIRTRGTLLEYTRFPGEYHKPLGHLSVRASHLRRSAAYVLASLGRVRQYARSVRSGRARGSAEAAVRDHIYPKPLGRLSGLGQKHHNSLAESEGFEPPIPFGTPDFESGSISHSDSSPVSGHATCGAGARLR